MEKRWYLLMVEKNLNEPVLVAVTDKKLYTTKELKDFAKNIPDGE